MAAQTAEKESKPIPERKDCSEFSERLFESGTWFPFAFPPGWVPPGLTSALQSVRRCLEERPDSRRVGRETEREPEELSLRSVS